MKYITVNESKFRHEIHVLVTLLLLLVGHEIGFSFYGQVLCLGAYSALKITWLLLKEDKHEMDV